MEFKLIVDTGTWFKLEKLLNLNVINSEFMRSLYRWNEIIITPQIKKELKYFSNSAWDQNKTYIIPVKYENKYNQAINDGFDKADASIFGLPDLEDSYILTEDRPLLKYGKIHQMPILFFIDYLVVLLQTDVITKTLID